jgi:hypothetical protein
VTQTRGPRTSRCAPMALSDWLDAEVPSPTCRPVATPSLSFGYKSPCALKIPPFLPTSPQCRGEPAPDARHWLAVAPRHHSSIHSAQLLLLTPRAFCPRFRHERPLPPPSSTHHAGVFRRPMVSSSLSASHHRQGAKLGA